MNQRVLVIELGEQVRGTTACGSAPPVVLASLFIPFCLVSGESFWAFQESFLVYAFRAR